MALIDVSYFFGQINIAQKNDVSASLLMFIDEHEEKLLTDLFGYEFHKAYKLGITALDPIMIDIRDGKEYINRNGIFSKWNGLKFADGTAKKSLIANYIYYQWVEDQITITTGTGQKVADNQNASNSPSVAKMVSAWNKMVDWIYDLIEFLLSNPLEYPLFQDQYGRIPTNLLRHQNIFGI